MTTNLLRRTLRPNHAEAWKSVPLALFVSLGLLTGCSSSNASDDAASAMGGKGKVKVPPAKGGGSTSTGGTTTTPSPTTNVTSTYDTSVGMGVDSNGFASLPLRAGAHRYFVSSAAGSDANGCAAAQQPDKPLATIAAAKACLGSGAGDQLLVAEGTRYAEGLTNMMDQMGYNAAYPTVIQSYDPADALNEAKYGHAANGQRPVVNTGAQPHSSRTSRWRRSRRRKPALAAAPATSCWSRKARATPRA